MEMKKWNVLGQTRAGLFAVKDIGASEELTWNYQLDSFEGHVKMECKCGASNCSGWIGLKPKKEEEPSPPHAKKRKTKAKQKQKQKQKQAAAEAEAAAKAEAAVGAAALAASRTGTQQWIHWGLLQPNGTSSVVS